MLPPGESTAIGADKKSKTTVWLGWTVVLVLLAYFLWKYIPHYFTFTPESYGDFWARRGWLIPHLSAGALAILIGPVQFWPRMRRDYLQAHRVAGRVYVVLVFIGALAALGLARKIEGLPAYSLGLVGLAVAWLTTTTMAFVAIRRKKLDQHRQWMVRSYVVTFAFVTFRLCDDSMRGLGIMSVEERSKLLAWACWAVPLLVTEVILQGRTVFASRDR